MMYTILESWTQSSVGIAKEIIHKDYKKRLYIPWKRKHFYVKRMIK